MPVWFRPPRRSTFFPCTTLFRSRFVLENPELIKLWIDDFIAPGDIRDRYPLWDIAGSKDRTSTRLNSSHVAISYAVLCLIKNKHAMDAHNARRHKAAVRRGGAGA